MRQVAGDNRGFEAGGKVPRQTLTGRRIMRREFWAKCSKAGGALVCLLVCLPSWCPGGDGKKPPVERESAYSKTTLLLCNSRVPESVALAQYYAAARKIPARNLLRLPLEPTEEITRTVYETKIAAPLRELLLRQGWWMPERDPATGQQSLRSQFHILVLFRGMPLKILAAREQEGPMESSAASVDSELAALGCPGLAWEGPAKNPYFGSELPFAQAALPIQLVGRIDGPGADQCRRMIDEALQAESTGLWGNAYVDLAPGERDPGAGWLKAAAGELRGQGVPVTVNRFAQSFPRGYPLKDPAFYLASKQEELDGPVDEPALQFRPGAIAAHLAEGSAATLWDSKKTWVAALLQRGAAAAVGSVGYSGPAPSHRLDILVDRLIKGHTWVESAAMACETLSWTGVVLGDPLYRPFAPASERVDEGQYGKDDMLPYKVIRLAHGRWGQGPAMPAQELILKLEMASAKLPRPELIEHLGLLASEMGNLRDARTHFLRARSQYASPEDQLRMDLHMADLAWSQNDKLRALKIWREAAETFHQIPASRAAVEYMKIFQTAQQ